MTKAVAKRAARKPPAPPASATTPHVDKAWQYVTDVRSGKVLACKWIRLACDRHVADMAASQAKDSRFVFDNAAAERVCRFAERFPHVKGRWAAKRELLVLEPWQCFIFCSIFGWLMRESGYRRFRKARIYTTRKQGKSLIAAPIGLYMFVADNEPGAEVFSGATNEKQAWEVFGPAKQMASLTPDFVAHYGVGVNAKTLTRLSDMSKFEPVIGKPGDGSSPHCAIIDEFHEHDTDAQLATMETGMGARTQPLSLIVSTAGDNLAGPCRADWLDCQNILEGTVKDEQVFAVIYTIDPDVDWTSEAALRMANPNYDISVTGEFLMAQQTQAINSPRHQGHFKTKHLNIWVQARDAFINMQRWAECKVTGLKLSDLFGKRCVIGMDLASKIDLTALVLVFPLENGRYAMFGKYYLPEETVEQPENQHYRTWHAAGHLTATEGNATDYFHVLDDIKELAAMFDVQEIAYDPYNATMLVTALQNENLPMVEFGQTVLNMSEPMKQVEALIKDRKIEHDGDPVMEWAMSNVTAKLDRKDNIYPTKERPENKIDPFVALCLAMGRLMIGAEPEKKYQILVF